MKNSVLTQKEGVYLLCKKIAETLEPGSIKDACIKTLKKVPKEGEILLLALKGIRTGNDIDNPGVRRTIRRIAEEINLPYDEALNDLRAFVSN